ncbi:hypothetical protein ABTQ08_20670, partial [Acinetobacter baumannii]
NGQAYELWGLTAEEVEDQNLFGLEFGLPIEQIKAQLRAVLAGLSDREEAKLSATNRRGRPFTCHVTLLPLGSADDGSPSGLILMMEAAA